MKAFGQAVHGSELEAFSRGPLQHADSVAQSQVLQVEGSARTEDRGQNCEEYRERTEHRRRIMKESIIPHCSDISRFSRGKFLSSRKATIEQCRRSPAEPPDREKALELPKKVLADYERMIVKNIRS